MTASLPNSRNCRSSFSDSTPPITRNRPRSNFRAMTRAKSERTEWMADGNTPTLYWLKQGAGKFTLRRWRATRPIPHARFHRLSSLSRGIGDYQRAAVTAPLCFGRISRLLCLAYSSRLSTPGVDATFPSLLEMKNHHGNCAAWCAAIFNGWAPIFCAASNSRPCRWKRWRHRLRLENLDAVHRELRAGHPVVLILSHLANWELFAHILPKFIGYVRNSTIYQRLGNRFIDEHVRRVRGRAGVEMFDRREGFEKAIKLLRGGGAIGILSDQHAGDHGLWVPFFGRLASTSPLPALLAKRTGAALIGVAIYTDGRARWRIVVSPALDAKRRIGGIAYRENKRAYRVSKSAARRKTGFGCIIAGKRPSPIFFSRVTNAASICHPTFRPKI